MSSEEPLQQKNPSWGRMFLSVCSALLGVQSDKNLSTDFSSGRIWPFIVIGLMVVMVFVLSLILVIKLFIL
ncbi:MAG: hypothetical protein OFPII_21530 [Osedax symbiont Rs1]|nr:MAG: hypothetical protein OFPII_21530 [Osedax symbiont Rs1]